ncbi:hypothetical protein BTUL_0224g00160 [Botrytis tulipae]|uniref:Uncharacterized protein n=1 Tax=Botrytis tulipae TaxID=87230 RepID=A0A4Z1EC00_9HELO|nr:hypothetical protein BTUL_0224g00160 [Botrytis tulipae]
MATSTPATMATPKWSTWASTTRSTKFLELHDLVVNRSLSPAHGPMTSGDLNYIIRGTHITILRQNPNIAQDVYNYLLERNVWRYCFVENMDFNVEHPRYPGKHPVSNPNMMMAEDGAKMTAWENLAAATQATKK